MILAITCIIESVQRTGFLLVIISQTFILLYVLICTMSFLFVFFKGDFRRRPEQRLGGKSSIESRNAIIAFAQAERSKREVNKYIAKCSTKYMYI